MTVHSRSSIEVERQIADLLRREVVSAGVAPAAAAGIWIAGAARRSAVGCAGGASPDSVFDLASITKTYVALTTSLLVEEGKLRWSTQLRELLPWLQGTPGGEATIEAHLSHRAGLAAHRELFLGQQAGLAVRPRELLFAAACAVREPPTSGPLYSDLGYLLVGEALQALSGEPLDQIVRGRLTAPRGWAIASARQWHEQDAEFRRAVPTEIVPGRGGVVRGLVHDDNAWALAGSALCGHAGLFGTVGGVLDLGRWLLDAALDRGDLARAAVALLQRRPEGSLRLGLDGVSPVTSAAGTRVGPNTFGHLGFTGTSLWCDPDQQIAICLLTNRVHPSRDNRAIVGARPRVHDALFDLAGALQSGPT
jgi:CubicO group peptidase (beta-lactamase class C family)